MTGAHGLTERMHYLKQFQFERLQHTYADFIAQEQYRATCNFFFGKVYTAEDTSARDQAFVKFYDHLSRILGGDIIRCLRKIIELQELTVVLDEALEQQLIAEGAPVAFDMITYENAYAACDNYEPRLQQIQVLDEALLLAHKVLRRFGIGAGLKALHSFQTLRGEAEVTGFLVEAYNAIAHLRKIKPLAEVINQREIQRLDRIFGR
ncbi:MAG: hypothetical protein QNK37_07650 [Acidobacteriota bacterium]|nr:hypothetical protein [Acidobacteriota bacterium]